MFEDLVEYMVKSLVDHPEQVRVEESSSGRLIVCRVRVAPGDVGRVVGRGGRIVNAMRALLRVAAVRTGKRATLEIE